MRIMSVGRYLHKLRACWEWATDNRGPLAFVSVGIKFIRVCALLPLLYHFMPVNASNLAWFVFWLYGLCQVVAWLLDSVLDADGSGS